ncbi:MAG: N-acetyltransferase [Frankiales bacterium]|nr:N-acetyltransferase [Frankiales bacterium]
MAEEVRRDADENRFEMWVDGQLAGFADYRDHEGVRAFTHTVIEPAYGGRGLASRLIGVALEETREAGLTVLAICPFVKDYLAREGSHGQ